MDKKSPLARPGLPVRGSHSGRTVDDDPQGSRQNTNSVPLPALCGNPLPIVRP